MNDCDLTNLYASLEKQLYEIVSKLEQSGYQFASDTSAVLPPHPDTESFIHLFESNGLRLPIALQAFYRRFGGINLSGRHADWPEANYPDPLWVDPLELVVDELQRKFLASKEEREWYQEVYGGFYFVIAPEGVRNFV